MAKIILRLDPEDQYDFMLIGIVCQHKDYRLCHELNTGLRLKLVRENDFELFNGKRMEKITFPFYSYKTAEEDQYFLLANKGKQGFLVPEQKQVDFFLMIRENVKRIDEADFYNRIKEMKVILGVYKMEPRKLKSRENLLF